MLQTRSSILLVAVVNTQAGGSAVVITNSQNLGVNVQNSAGWIVYVANTVAGGSAVSVTNSAGWIMAQSNTSPLVQVQNSAGWVMAQSNTAGITVNVINSGGWVFSQSNTSGLKVFATLETAQMSSNGVALTAGYAIINASGTNNTIVSAVSAKKIRVLSFNMMSSVGNNAIFQSGTGASNLLTGTYFMGSNGGIVAPYNPVGLFESSGGNLLNLKLSAAQSVGGVLTYLEI